MPSFLALLLGAPIGLDAQVVRLPDLVQELGTKGGIRLAVTRELANELIYVRAKPRPLDEWMRLLAEAACAEWETDGKTRRLSRSPGFRQRLEKAEIAARTAQLQEGVRKEIGMPAPAIATAADFEAPFHAAMAVPRSAPTGLPEPDARARLQEANKDLLPSRRLLRRILTPEVL